MKKLFASTAIIVALGGCASGGMELPSTDYAAAMPRAVNASGSGSATTLPLISDLYSLNTKRSTASSPGVKRPNRGEMRGTTWITELDSDSEYVLPVQTTNATGTRTVQQTLVTADLPVGQGSCSHSGFQAVPFGSAVAIAPLAGAPVGVEVACSVMIGGKIAKLMVKATSGRSISELRFKARKKGSGASSFPTGVCSDANYQVSNLVKGGPLGACVIVDATGANSATYVKIPGTGGYPLVKVGDGVNARLARSTVDRLPTGERLIRIDGPQEQIVLQYPNGEQTVLTRGM